MSHGRHAYNRAKRREDEVKAANEARFTCPNYRSGACSPAKFGCQCYKNGMCVEAKA